MAFLVWFGLPGRRQTSHLTCEQGRTTVVSMRWLGFVVVVLAFWLGPIGAVQANRYAALEQFQTELDRLARLAGADSVQREIEQARALLNQARLALRQGDEGAQRSLLALVPLQLRLVEELFQAAALEQQADQLEQHVLAAQQAGRAVRDELDRLLEEIVAAQVAPLW